MSTVILEINDNYLDKTLEVLNALKDVMIIDIKLQEEHNSEEKDFMALSDKSFEKVWDNEEDSVYDKFLEKI